MNKIMSKYLIEKDSLTSIGDSIRNVLNNTETYSPAEMANIIDTRMLGVPDPIVVGDFPISGLTTSTKVTSTSYTDIGMNFTANRAGTYRFKWCCMKPAVNLGGGTPSSALFLNNAQQFENSSFSDNVQYNSVDVTMAKGDTVSVKAKHSGGIYATYVYGVNVCIEWNDANSFFV